MKKPRFTDSRIMAIPSKAEGVVHVIQKTWKKLPKKGLVTI
jgi:hypothetical protein